MTEIAPLPPANRSRLVRCLGGLIETEGGTGLPPQAERLAQLIDFADSVRLSSALDTLPGLACKPGEESAAAVTAHFLREREAIVRWVVGSFAGDGGYRKVSLPAPPESLSGDIEADFRPYLNFYAGQQREIEFRLHTLQRETREAVAGLTPRLARLVELERVLGDTLASHARVVLQGIPQLLAARFATLAAACPAAGVHGRPGAGWHDRFRDDMQAALLAEIDARLLPVLGLIEAVNNEARRENDNPIDTDKDDHE